MINEITETKIVNKKWAKIVALVFIFGLIITAIVGFFEIRRIALLRDNFFFGATVSPDVGMMERLDFLNTIKVTLGVPWPAFYPVFAIFFILEAILIYRLVAIWKLKSNLKKLIAFIVYELLIVLGLCLLMGTVFFAVSEALTFDAGHFVPMATKQEFMNAKVTTDKMEIKSMIDGSKERIVLVGDPAELLLPETFRRSFLETDIIPRYVKYYEHEFNAKFAKYDKLPYYFVAPHFLVIKDRNAFLNDLGESMDRSSISWIYSQYLTKAFPKFLIVPGDQFQSRYNQVEASHFKTLISTQQVVIDENNAVIASNEKLLAQDVSLVGINDPRYQSVAKQVADIRQTALAENSLAKKNIRRLQAAIASFNDPNDIHYRSGKIIYGAFIQPDVILMKEFNQDDLYLLSANESLRILVHESLHYFAYSDRYTSSLDDFFLEGCTEYLALKALGYDDKDLVYVSGYPVHIQVMTELAKRIPLDELEKIDFTQNQKLLEADIKKYFPQVDYPALSALLNEMQVSWFTNDFGQANYEYIDTPNILKVKKLLGVNE
ncbi:MAG: hypothetical protein V4438_01445 [Patescibacteria group bacterium]